VEQKRPTFSEVVPPSPASRAHRKPGDRARLTRAEARALRRSAPLTPQQFRELSRLADQGISPLRHMR